MEGLNFRDKFITVWCSLTFLVANYHKIRKGKKLSFAEFGPF
jgi:hypothetical protein